MHTPFTWPEGKRVAVSLSFDDARLTQPDTGIPILDTFGVKGTFYVSMHGVNERVDAWLKAVATGHEIGNHTISHPCSANFRFDKFNALEDYTLERMEEQMLEASEVIESTFGVCPATFGYPCGQAFVGSGADRASYVPLVAKHFVAGRGFRNEAMAAPEVCDLAMLPGLDFDGRTWDEVRSMIEHAAGDSRWLILAGHEVSEGGGQAVLPDTLESVCKHASDPANGIWIDTVETIARYVSNARNKQWGQALISD